MTGKGKEGLKWWKDEEWKGEMEIIHQTKVRVLTLALYKLPFPFHIFPILTGPFLLLRPKSGARKCNASLKEEGSRNKTETICKSSPPISC